jgi:NitT/TauT family transport system substrate-binding protein
MIASPLFAGVEKGIFLKYGLDLKIQIVDAAAGAIKALQAGEADQSSGAIGSFIGGLSEGVPLKAYGVIVGDSRVVNTDEVFSLIASGSSGITKPEELKGKKLGAQAGTTIDTYLRNILAKYGISPNEVEIQNVNQVNTVQALAQGVDAVTTNEPYGELALATAPGAKLLIRGGGFIAQRVVLFAADETVKKNAALFEQALTATYDCMQFARKNPDETADVTTRWLAGNLDPQVLRKAIRHHVYDPRLTPQVAQSWESENKNLIDQKKIKEPVPFSAGFDRSLTDKILTAHPELISDLS